MGYKQMAGDWIVWVKGLAKRREVAVISSKLGRGRHEIAGRLMELWEWCDDNFSDADIVSDEGDVSLFLGDEPFAFVDALLGLPGLAEILASPEVRWLEARSGGRCIFPNLARHNGTSAKTRASSRKKKKLQRERASEPAPDDRIDLSPTCPPKTGTTEQKKRELIPLTHPPPEKRTPDIPDLPAELNTPSFVEAWGLWETYRKTSDYGVIQPMQRISILAELAKLGPVAAEEQVRLSLRRGWKHVYLDAKESHSEPGRTGKRSPHSSATQRAVPGGDGSGNDAKRYDGSRVKVFRHDDGHGGKQPAVPPGQPAQSGG